MMSTNLIDEDDEPIDNMSVRERIDWWARRRRCPPAPTTFLDDVLRRAMHPRRATDVRARHPEMFRGMPFEGPGPRFSVRELDELETRYGLRFPDVYRELLVHVGDGGYGPGYGMLPLIRRKPGGEHTPALEFYEAYRLPGQEAGWSWPENLLPLFDWGCLTFSCIECSEKSSRVIRATPGDFDPEESAVPFESTLKVEAVSLEVWLRQWSQGMSHARLSPSAG